MSKKKKLLISSIILMIVSIIYTLLVKYVDVGIVGKESVKVGFSTLNKWFYDINGVKDSWYKITKYLGLLPFILCAYYGFIGIKQLIKNKSIKKVDRNLLYLAIFYVLVLITYIFFEKVIINYRPVLEDGVLEASYPSSHTMLAMCICLSSILISKSYIKEKYLKPFNIITFIFMIFLVIGRLLSGYHWISDIIGGVIISLFLVSIYNYLINKEK